MKTIGITGGIGSGKSFICDKLKQKGFPVYEADVRALNLIETQNEIKQNIISLLGPESFTPNGNYNRAFVSNLVFKNPDLLEKLNKIIHPATTEDFKHFTKKIAFENPDCPFLFKEAAILFEAGTYTSCDAVILVFAPEKLRIKRVMERSGISEENIINRIRNQWTEIRKLNLADYVVINDGYSDSDNEIMKLLAWLKYKFNRDA
jgi:dephospho-CoA kinase